jgi:hypothetical protein
VLARAAGLIACATRMCTVARARTFQGREYSIWVKKRLHFMLPKRTPLKSASKKMLRMVRSAFPKSSFATFGEHKLVTKDSVSRSNASYGDISPFVVILDSSTTHLANLMLHPLFFSPHCTLSIVRPSLPIPNDDFGRSDEHFRMRFPGKHFSTFCSPIAQFLIAALPFWRAKKSHFHASVESGPDPEIHELKMLIR